MHYIIISVVILIIVIRQISIFIDTKRKTEIFRSIFSPDINSYKYGADLQYQETITKASEDDLKKKLIEGGFKVDDFFIEDGMDAYVFDSARAMNCLIEDCPFENDISSDHFNPIFEEIKNGINNYLENNKGSVSDYHLMKDIVDRNCDAKEDEISTQIPVPLYLGLMGTMVGILVGVGYLWISGDLSALLNGGMGNSGSEGVEALLGGVALAMISSILGIFLTTRGSMKAKNAKAEEEKNKHIFLSWIQANLLPRLSNDTAQTLERMSNNLVSFNNTFSSNTDELGKTLSQVNEATKLQKQLMEAVEKLNDKEISKQNLELYSVLRSSSQEIASLGSFLKDSNQYLANVRELNEKLDKNEKRTLAIEEMAEFFKKELAQINERKESINKAVGEVDSRLEETFRKLTQHAEENVEAFQVALGKQQDVLQRKLYETQILIDELKNLSSIKESIAKFEKATTEQNRKIDKLAENIRILAEAKTNGIASEYHEPIGLKTRDAVIPIWKKIIIWSCATIGIILLLSLAIANWDAIYSFLLNFLRF